MYDFGNKDLGAINDSLNALNQNNAFNTRAIVKITEITPAVLNALANNADTFTLTVTNAIPIGKYYWKAFSNTKIALVSDTEILLRINSVVPKALTTDQKYINDVGTIQEFEASESTDNINIANDIEINITMSDNNAQDWITGVIPIYIVLIDFPNTNDLQ